MIETLILLLVLSLINALYINGFKRAFEYEVYSSHIDTDSALAGEYDALDSAVFGRVHYTFVKWFGVWWARPFFSCVACMASFHSLYFFWPAMAMVVPFTPSLILVYLAYIPVTSALAYLIQHISE